MNNSKKILKELVETLKLSTGKTQEELSIGAGYKGKSLTQALSKENGHNAVIKRLELIYKEVLKIPTLTEEDLKTDIQPKHILREPAHTLTKTKTMEQDGNTDLLASLIAANLKQSEALNLNAKARLNESENQKNLIAELRQRSNLNSVPEETILNDPAKYEAFVGLLFDVASGKKFETREDLAYELGSRIYGKAKKQSDIQKS